MKYYQHDTSSFDDEKISELFLGFGYEGLGLFYTILEKIAKQEKPVKTSVLKHQLKVGKKLEKCWSFMESLQLIYSNNGETFNENILKYSGKYQIEKESTKERVAKWRERQVVNENVTRYKDVSNGPKVNKSKVNKSKVNTSPDASAPDTKNSGDDFDEERIKTLHTKVKNSFLAFYQKKFEIEYYFEAKDGKKVNALISKITKKIKEKNSAKKEKIPIGDDEILIAFNFYIRKATEIGDHWVISNYTLSMLDSKFNELYNQIKNGNKNATAAATIANRTIASATDSRQGTVSLAKQVLGIG